MSSRAPDVDRAATERAAYIHIPFCHRRCPYCDFAVVDLEQHSTSFERYVRAVVAEIEMEEPWGTLQAVNIGGGTPSVLRPNQLSPILNALDNRFGIDRDAEVSIEANPEDWSLRYARSVHRLGVNRVSLGVQSFDAAVLQALGRQHTPGQGRLAVENAQAVEMDVVNLDLIFGTPGESLASWHRTVMTALDLQTDHLSAYGLTVERGTSLSRAVRDGAPSPDADDQADKYELLVEAAAFAGLEHYEVSNWARPRRCCRYNLTTWAQGEYLAFGLGAHSHRAQQRSRNVRRLDQYLRMVEDGRRPVAGSEQLGGWERAREKVFLGLRRRDGVAVDEVVTAWLQSAAGLRFLEAGIVAVDSGRFVVTQPLLTDAVTREVLALESPSSE